MNVITRKIYWLNVLLTLLGVVMVTYFYPINVRADSKITQTEVSKYAMQWDGHTEIPYVLGGPGGRTIMSLEECSEKGESTDCSGFTTMVYKHFGIDITAYSESQKDEAVKTFTDEKDAIPGDICYWYGHVAIYIGDGKIIHTNTSKPPTNYPHISTFAGEGANYRTPELYLRMVDDVEKLKPLNGSSAEETQEKVEEAVGYGDIITESDLTGMPTESSLEFYREKVLYADRSMLSKYEIKKLEAIEGNLDNTSLEYKIIRLFHVSQTVFGIICIFYGVLLFLAYLLDYYNQYIEFSLLGLITFGKFRILDPYDEKNLKGYRSSSGVTYVTFGMIVLRSAVIVTVGMLLISGILSRLLLNIIFIIQRWLY